MKNKICYKKTVTLLKCPLFALRHTAEIRECRNDAGHKKRFLTKSKTAFQIAERNTLNSIDQTRQHKMISGTKWYSTSNSWLLYINIEHYVTTRDVLRRTMHAELPVRALSDFVSRSSFALNQIRLESSTAQQTDTARPPLRVTRGRNQTLNKCLKTLPLSSAPIDYSNL
jgi:hypothetical protein